MGLKLLSPPREGEVQPRRAAMIEWTLSIIAVITILTIFTVIVIWLAVQPKSLHYSVERGSLVAYNFSSDHLTARFHFVVISENPNRRVSFYYDKTEATVSYSDHELCDTSVPPFYQRRRNTTALELDMAAENVVVPSPAAAGDLGTEIDSGTVDVELRIRAKTRMRIGIFKVHRTLTVLCGPVTVPLSPAKGFKRVKCDADVSE